MRKGYSTLFNSPTTPVFDMSSMYKFNQPEPESPIGTLAGRFNFKPKTTLQQDADSISKDEDSEPSFSATKALLDYVKSAPKREDYNLGFGGKLAAALAGAAAGYKDPMSGVQTAMALKDKPYKDAMETYESKLPALELQAKIEESAFGRDLKYKQMFQDYLKDQGELGVKQGELKVHQGQLDEEINKNKRDYEINKQRYAAEGYKEFTDEKGDTYLFNPATNDKKLIGRSIKNREVGALESNATSNRISANADATSAGASVINANVNRDRLTQVDVPRANSEVDRNKVLNDLTQEQIAKSQDIDPQEQLYANALAAKEVVQEFPGYAKFVNPDGSINFDAIQTGGWFTDDAGSKDFLEKVKAKVMEDMTKPVLERKYKRPVKLNRPGLTVPIGGK